MRWPSPKIWAWIGIIMAVTAIVYWKWTQGKVESERSELLARQRAVVTELGPRWFPMRDKIERWTLDLAKDPGTEVVEKDILKGWGFRDKPGIYLRLDLEQATDEKAVRSAVNESLRDGFSSCLFTAENKSQPGKECKRTRECELGEICSSVEIYHGESNAPDRCTRPSQPYNLRVAYRAMRILSEDWIREAQETTGELKLRAFKEFFEDTVRDDLKVAVDLLTRAQYFVLVLDEPVPNLNVPKGATRSEVLRSIPHPSRVGIWRLSDGKLVLRIRRVVDVEFQQSGAITDETVLAAQKRQALSCALASSVRDAMGDTDSGLVKPQ